MNRQNRGAAQGDLSPRGGSRRGRSPQKQRHGQGRQQGQQQNRRQDPGQPYQSDRGSGNNRQQQAERDREQPPLQRQGSWRRQCQAAEHCGQQIAGPTQRERRLSSRSRRSPLTPLPHDNNQSDGTFLTENLHAEGRGGSRSRRSSFRSSRSASKESRDSIAESEASQRSRKSSISSRETPSHTKSEATRGKKQTKAFVDELSGSLAAQNYMVSSGTTAPVPETYVSTTSTSQTYSTASEASSHAQTANDERSEHKDKIETTTHNPFTSAEQTYQGAVQNSETNSVHTDENGFHPFSHTVPSIHLSEGLNRTRVDQKQERGDDDTDQSLQNSYGLKNECISYIHGEVPVSTTQAGDSPAGSFYYSYSPHSQDAAVTSRRVSMIEQGLRGLLLDKPGGTNRTLEDEKPYVKFVAPPWGQERENLPEPVGPPPGDMGMRRELPEPIGPPPGDMGARWELPEPVGPPPGDIGERRELPRPIGPPSRNPNRRWELPEPLGPPPTNLDEPSELPKPIGTPPATAGPRWELPKPVGPPPVEEDNPWRFPKPCGNIPDDFGAQWELPEPLGPPPADVDARREWPKPIDPLPGNAERRQELPKPLGPPPSNVDMRWEPPNPIGSPPVRTGPRWEFPKAAGPPQATVCVQWRLPQKSVQPSLDTVGAQWELPNPTCPGDFRRAPMVPGDMGARPELPTPLGPHPGSMGERRELPNPVGPPPGSVDARRELPQPLGLPPSALDPRWFLPKPSRSPLPPLPREQPEPARLPDSGADGPPQPVWLAPEALGRLPRPVGVRPLTLGGPDKLPKPLGEPPSDESFKRPQRPHTLPPLPLRTPDLYPGTQSVERERQKPLGLPPLPSHSPIPSSVTGQPLNEPSSFSGTDANVDSLPSTHAQKTGGSSAYQDKPGHMGRTQYEKPTPFKIYAHCTSEEEQTSSQRNSEADQSFERATANDGWIPLSEVMHAEPLQPIVEPIQPVISNRTDEPSRQGRKGPNHDVLKQLESIGQMGGHSAEDEEYKAALQQTIQSEQALLASLQPIGDIGQGQQQSQQIQHVQDIVPSSITAPSTHPSGGHSEARWISHDGQEHIYNMPPQERDEYQKDLWMRTYHPKKWMNMQHQQLLQQQAQQSCLQPLIPRPLQPPQFPPPPNGNHRFSQLRYPPQNGDNRFTQQRFPRKNVDQRFPQQHGDPRFPRQRFPGQNEDQRFPQQRFPQQHGDLRFPQQSENQTLPPTDSQQTSAKGPQQKSGKTSETLSGQSERGSPQKSTNTFESSSKKSDKGSSQKPEKSPETSSRRSEKRSPGKSGKRSQCSSQRSNRGSPENSEKRSKSASRRSGKESPRKSGKRSPKNGDVPHRFSASNGSDRALPPQRAGPEPRQFQRPERSRQHFDPREPRMQGMRPPRQPRIPQNFDQSGQGAFRQFSFVQPLYQNGRGRRNGLGPPGRFHGPRPRGPNPVFQEHPQIIHMPDIVPHNVPDQPHVWLPVESASHFPQAAGPLLLDPAQQQYTLQSSESQQYFPQTAGPMLVEPGHQQYIQFGPQEYVAGSQVYIQQPQSSESHEQFQQASGPMVVEPGPQEYVPQTAEQQQQQQQQQPQNPAFLMEPGLSNPEYDFILANYYKDPSPPRPLSPPDNSHAALIRRMKAMNLVYDPSKPGGFYDPLAEGGRAHATYTAQTGNNVTANGSQMQNAPNTAGHNVMENMSGGTASSSDASEVTQVTMLEKLRVNYDTTVEAVHQFLGENVPPQTISFVDDFLKKNASGVKGMMIRHTPVEWGSEPDAKFPHVTSMPPANESTPGLPAVQFDPEITFVFSDPAVQIDHQSLLVST